jgi:uncharacterized protein (UPF0261 family)
MKKVVLVGTLDTKSEEALFIKRCLEGREIKVITIDMGTGMRGKPIFVPDHVAEEVARAAGTTLSDLLDEGRKAREMAIMEKMVAGASTIVTRLYSQGDLHGIISLGGTMGTNMGTGVMRSLPFGVPKVMLSTAASGDTRHWVGTKDIAMMPSVADIVGLNRITRVSLRNAAGALAGMVLSEEEPVDSRPLVGVTTLGNTTECALKFKNRLEEKGYEVAIFHAIGTGGMAMEELIADGKIQGVFDLSTNELIDHLYGGLTDAGPKRLEAAGARGIPHLVVPGNLDHLLYASLERIPDRFKGKKVHAHGPAVHLMRSGNAEMEEVGKVMAEKLNRAKGPVRILFPLKGFSIMNLVNKGELADPEADRVLLETLRRNLRPDIGIIECDMHINDEAFAFRAAEAYLDLHKTKGQ